MLLPRLILLLVILMTVGIYWSGLSGPFIFDDPWNLEPVRLWLAGQASLREVLLPHPTILFSRPVSMASFALTAITLGADSFGFKLGNLLVHLVCGLLGWALLRAVLARDARLAPHAELLASLGAAIWLLHPLQVSTVLYAVQRMAQLATLFSLGALCVYLVGRQQWIDGRRRAAWLNLFAAFPALVLLGVLSKQNAAIAPMLCLALELAYFNRASRVGRLVPSFIGLFIALPALAASALLVFAPQRLLGTYAEWDFTLWQRLLTQGRALVDYVGMLLLPRGPLMGLYTDDFAVSQSLLAPPSTVLALATLVAISAMAIALRKRAPSVFAGWFFFLVAHAVESSFLPLEMYYEHRNYLPSLGLFLAVLGLLAVVPSVSADTAGRRKLGAFAAGGLVLVLAVATLGRVLVWQDMGTIVQQGVKVHPDSLRARFDLAAWALSRGDADTARDAMHHLTASRAPRHRQLGHLSLLTVNCMRGVDESNLAHLEAASGANLSRLTTFEAQSFVRLAGVTRENGCGALGHDVIASHLQRIVDAAAAQPETAAPKWFSRYALAEIYARDGQWMTAQHHAALAWEASRDKKIGVFLGALLVRNGAVEQARALRTELGDIVKPYDQQGQAALDELDALIEARQHLGAASATAP